MSDMDWGGIPHNDNRHDYIWRDYRSTRDVDLLKQGIVDAKYVEDPYHYYAYYEFTPRVAGHFTTKTQHKVWGDKTYEWEFVNSGIPR